MKIVFIVFTLRTYIGFKFPEFLVFHETSGLQWGTAFFSLFHLVIS